MYDGKECFEVMYFDFFKIENKFFKFNFFRVGGLFC